MTSDFNVLDCEIARRMVSEASSDDLHAQLTSEVEAHLAACDSCADYRREMATLAAHLSGLSVPAPPELLPRLVAALPVGRVGVNRRLLIAVGFLMAAIAAAAVSWYVNFGRQPDPMCAPVNAPPPYESVEQVSVRTGPNTVEYLPISPPVRRRSTPSPSGPNRS